MKYLLFPLILLLSSPLTAQTLAPRMKMEVQGGVVFLHQDKQVCVERARYAVWESKDGKLKIGGCWTWNPETDNVEIAYFDSDFQTYPVRGFVEEKGI